MNARTRSAKRGSAQWWFLRMMRDSRFVGAIVAFLFVALAATLWAIATQTRVLETYRLVGRLEAAPAIAEKVQGVDAAVQFGNLVFVEDTDAVDAVAGAREAELRIGQGKDSQRLRLGILGPAVADEQRQGFLRLPVRVEGGSALATMLMNEQRLVGMVLRLRGRTLLRVLRDGSGVETS